MKSGVHKPATFAALPWACAARPASAQWMRVSAATRRGRGGFADFGGRKGDAGRMCDEAGKNRVSACFAE